MHPTPPTRPLQRLLLALLAALAIASASATSYLELDFDEMLQKADLVAFAEVLDVRVEARDGRPWTVVALEPIAPLRGFEEREPDTPLELAFLGGSLPGGASLTVSLMPAFSAGESLLLLAYDGGFASPIVGFRQGLWRERDGVLVDDAGRVLTVVDGALQLQGDGSPTDAVLDALRARLGGGL